MELGVIPVPHHFTVWVIAPAGDKGAHLGSWMSSLLQLWRMSVTSFLRKPAGSLRMQEKAVSDLSSRPLLPLDRWPSLSSFPMTKKAVLTSMSPRQTVSPRWLVDTSACSPSWETWPDSI